MYRYQEDPRFFAQVGGSLEELAAAELRDLECTDVEPGVRGVHFRAEPRVLYRVIYAGQLLQRVIAPVLKFKCHNPDYLYRKVCEVDWRHHGFATSHHCLRESIRCHQSIHLLPGDRPEPG